MILCDYCGKPAKRATGKDLYPHRPDLFGKRFFRCIPCDAMVGCHADGRPLGRLANPELRKAKMAAHAAFDPIWKDGRLKRSEAYAWLSRALGIPAAECHIGMMGVEGCRAVVEACAKVDLDELEAVNDTRDPPWEGRRWA